MKPGNIQTFGEILGRSRPMTIGSFGAFGKGIMAPPPTVPQTLDVELAPGVNYMQDARCATGTKTQMAPCVGPNCDPGEQEATCVDDPEYAALVAQVEEAAAKETAEIEAKRQEEIAARAAEEVAFEEGRAGRRATYEQRAAVLRLEEKKSPLMLYILGGGALLLVITTVMMTRKGKSLPKMFF